MNLTLKTAKSPSWADAKKSRINLRVQFEELPGEELPFTAAPTDPEAHGRDIFQRAVAGEFGPVAAFVAPTPVIPASVTMRQARLALLGVGLLDGVEKAMAAIPDATQRRAAQIEWEYSAEVHRDRPWVVSMSTALGLSSAQLDQLFVQAAQL